MSRSLLIAALALGSATASAATFTITTFFDDTLGDSLDPVYVGTATLTYMASSQLTDGHYLWSNLISNYGMTYSMTLDLPAGGTTTFTQNDMVGMAYDSVTAEELIAGVTVTLVNGQFYFSNAVTLPDVNGPGSVLFRNGTHSFAAEPVTLDGVSPYRGSTFNVSSYSLGLGQNFNGVMMGNYGGSLTLGRSLSDSPVVPEPSTYGLALGGLALAAVALRRRRKA